MLNKEGEIMERYFPKGFYPFLILGAWIFFLSCASFTQAQAPPSDAYSIQKIEVTESASGYRVTIEAKKPFEYTVVKMANPLRLVVNLPQGELGKLAGPMQIQNGTINTIRSRQIDAAKRKEAQIEIGLDQLVEYDVTSEGNRLLIDFGKPVVALPQAAKKESERVEKKEAPVSVLPKEGKEGIKVAGKKEAPTVIPAKPASYVTAVDIAAKVDWVKVDIQGDGRMPAYRSFTLPKPSRLVVDLPKLRNRTAKRSIDVGSKLLKDIRIGQHPDKVRFVFTFPSTKVPPYRLTQEGQEVQLAIGQVKEEAKAEKPLEPVPPVRVAKAEPKAVEKAQEVIPPTPVIKPETLEKEATLAETKPIELENPQLSHYKGARLSLDFKDADIHNILRLIAEVSNLNIITSDDVKGKVTIRLVNVPWDQALDVILATKNLIKIEEGNVLRITTFENMTKDRQARQKEEEILIKTRETKLKLEEPAKKIIKVNYAKAIDLQKLLLERKDEGRGFLSPQGSVKSDERTNTLIIQDIRSNLEEIEQLVKELDTPTPQVLIEARIVQANTTFSRSLGIQWGGSYNQTSGSDWFWGLTGNNPNAAAGWGFTPSATPGASTPLIMPSNFVVNFPASTLNTPVGGMGVSFGKLTGSLVNLDLRLQLGETDNQTKVIARPKVATLDNKEAYIKQGEKIPYETTSQAGTQVQFIDAVLSLKVIPHVTPDGSILMRVGVTRDARGPYRSPVNQVPSIDNREAATEVLVHDGETLVIGGIYESEKDQNENRIPWLGQIPFLGWLFKSQETLNTRKELLIFITPTIIQAKTEV
jgi:type IV pilus secretin PilQ/predicted competence protein